MLVEVARQLGIATALPRRANSQTQKKKEKKGKKHKSRPDRPGKGAAPPDPLLRWLRVAPPRRTAPGRSTFIPEPSLRTTTTRHRGIRGVVPVPTFHSNFSFYIFSVPCILACVHPTCAACAYAWLLGVYRPLWICVSLLLTS